MMNKTSIEWVKNPDGTQGYSWNPITGCLNGCSYCYARKLANRRLSSRYLANTNTAPPFEGLTPLDDPFYPRFWQDRFNWHRTYSPNSGRGIFVCDMSDLFGLGIPEDWTRQVLRYIETEFEERFYLLTKQPQNLIKFSPFPANCWVGVSATNQSMYDAAVCHLGQIKASIKYISIEPYLSEIHLPNYKDVDWLIVGAQTNPYIYPGTERIDAIYDATRNTNTPLFLKDNLKRGMGVQCLVQEMPIFKPLE